MNVESLKKALPDKISRILLAKGKGSPLSLHRVFHSIRFKVNKVGIQRYPFFYVLALHIDYKNGRYAHSSLYLPDF